MNIDEINLTCDVMKWEVIILQKWQLKAREIAAWPLLVENHILPVYNEYIGFSAQLCKENI